MIPYAWDKDEGVSWEIILTPEALEAAAREMIDQRVIGWDVETDGLSPYKGKRIIGHAFAWRRPNGQIRSIYIPCRHASYLGLFDAVEQLDPEIVTAAVKPVLEGPALKCGHNLNFDVQFAAADGIEVAPAVHDTLIMARLQDENQASYQLPRVMERSGIPHQRGWKDFIKPDLAAQQKHFKMRKKEMTAEYGYKFVTIPRLGWYAVQDAAYELRLAEYQFPFCGQWGEIWAMEMELFWVGIDMTRRGVPVNRQLLLDLAAEQQALMDQLAPRIWGLAGEQFEITNDGQLRRILFDKLGYPSQGQTKGGKNTEKLDRVDDDALWSLERHYNSEVAALVRQFNASEKIISTYTGSIIDLSDDQGVLHGEFKQSGARTGRASMGRPNLQNVPTRTELGRRVKEAFTARQGMVRYCVDYSQIELRVLAHLSQDPLLLKVYREGLDAHATTAVEAFGTADKVDGVDMRRVAKILNFGIPFGITSLGVQRNINKDLPIGVPEIDESRAEGYLAAWFGKYAGVTAWRNAVWYQARSNNGLFWNLFGRPRRVPMILSDKGYEQRRAERQVVSSYVQGSAAEIVKFSMVECWKYLRAQTDCEAYLVLMIHDDLHFDCQPDGSAKTIRELARIMESTCQKRLTVPIKVDVEYFTTNWAEKQALKLGG